jgi:hypothetical protein
MLIDRSIRAIEVNDLSKRLDELESRIESEKREQEAIISEGLKKREAVL